LAVIPFFHPLFPLILKNPMSAMINCNDGFRPLSFYLEAI
jgi:uncharacterized repeat protein (TIGR04076 family)